MNGLEDIVSATADLITKNNIVMSAIFLPAGVVCLLYGLKLFHFIIAIPGLAIGAVLGYMAADVPGAVVLGVLFGLLAVVLFRLGVWLKGAALGLLLAIFLDNYYGWEGDWVWVAYVFIPLLSGDLALRLTDLLAIITTSATGAVFVSYALVNGWMILNGGLGYTYGFQKWIGMIAQGLDHHGIEGTFRYIAFELIAIAVLFLFGVFYQLRFKPKRGAVEQTDDKPVVLEKVEAADAVGRK
ncbi:hypothetical protein C882_1195 [Caenispirillum salinarum AK4]|uniref:DUF4203 domain-containing protein n=1 Tax=Caenispirillum salinarum AK4 TaxID=1238182 RepID=K9GTY7_9PROT|nr:DUF4203 domain-containing protein [Caenispirillum salinarum]EKV28194.1 hypothetical protein C882_1195 [Caenispirillum salinarum AK4]